MDSDFKQQVNINIGARLRAARLFRGFGSCKAFADLYRLRTTTYWAHEVGQNMISAVDAVFYAQTLRISVAWLLTGEGNPFEGYEMVTRDQKAKLNDFVRKSKIIIEFNKAKREELKQRLTQLNKEKNT